MRVVRCASRVLSNNRLNSRYNIKYKLQIMRYSTHSTVIIGTTDYQHDLKAHLNLLQYVPWCCRKAQKGFAEDLLVKWKVRVQSCACVCARARMCVCLSWETGFLLRDKLFCKAIVLYKSHEKHQNRLTMAWRRIKHEYIIFLHYLDSTILH